MPYPSQRRGHLREHGFDFIIREQKKSGFNNEVALGLEILEPMISRTKDRSSKATIPSLG
jgi:hypothetical protein